jgi:hypothetical protein
MSMLLQSGMARLPGDPALLVMYANFLIVHKDGQAARTQMQMAQRAQPSLLGLYNIYVAQQLAKQLKRGGIAACCIDVALHLNCCCCCAMCMVAQLLKYGQHTMLWAPLRVPTPT